MKNLLFASLILLLSISAQSQKVDIQVIKNVSAGISEWQILDNEYRQVFAGSTDFNYDSVSFTLEANKAYFFHITVIEIFDRTKYLYSLRLNGEPLLLIKSDTETGDQSYPFYTGIKYEPDKIIGGTTASISDYPWQILFRSGDYMCGGTLISRDWVVTAAHCTKEGNGTTIPIAEMFIIAGATNPFTSGEGQAYRVSQVIVHENFNRVALTNDIALLKLESSVNVQNSSPVRLITAGDVDEGVIDPGVMSWVTGWGLTRVSPNEFPNNLQRVQLPIVSNEQASTVWGSIPSGVLMAGYLNGNKDACSGDSGGPLVVSVDGVNKLAGIVSWGSENCDTYSGFTKVSDFTTWIRQKTGLPAEFTPAVPVGNVIVCPGEGSSQYTVAPVSGASDYEWSLFPESAGSITQGSSTANVVWNPRYFGEATLKVRITRNGEVSEWSRLLVKLARNTRLINQTGSRDICTGQPIRLNVVAEGDDIIYNWYKNGSLIRSGSEAEFNVGSASQIHAGDYTVELIGSCGSAMSAVMRVRVLPLTDITYVTRDTTVLFGDDAYLRVYAEGHNLEYKWLKDNELVSNDTNSILLENANANDIGVYKTIVTGTCGTEMGSNFYVYVERKIELPDLDVYLWPTLTREVLNVALSTDESYDIQIFTTMGRLMKYQRNCRYVTTLNVGNLTKGMYIINVITRNFKKSQKFVVY